ncbi:MAG: hypothetical protein SNH63_02600 [Rikenellaceae bacterium]
MKNLAKWFAPLLIGALIAPALVGCGDSGSDSGDTTPTTPLTPSEQQSQLQQIATNAIASIDVSSTEPVLSALEYLIDRLNGVELPEDLEWLVEEFGSQEDVVVELVEDVYVEGSGEYVYDSVYVGDEYDDYETDYGYNYSAAVLAKQLMSMSSIASGDMTVLANYATAATEEFSYLTYAEDMYGIYTLNSDDTWTTTASSDTFAYVVDGYMLSIKPSGSLYVTFPSEWDLEDVALTMPTAATVEFSYNGSTLMSVSMTISECNPSSYIFKSTASASVADFATTVNVDISNSASSATGVMTYKGTTVAEVAANVDNINIQSSINSEDLVSTGGASISVKLFDSALYLTGSISDLSGYIAAEEANDDAYPHFSTYERTYNEDTDVWTYDYTWGYDEAKYSNYCSIWNQYINIYWGFDSTSDVQGSVECDYEYEPEVDSYYSTYYNYTYTSYYGDIIPILVFEEGSRVAIDSFFSESAFETTINSAIELASDMVTLMSNHGFDLD